MGLDMQLTLLEKMPIFPKKMGISEKSPMAPAVGVARRLSQTDLIGYCDRAVAAL